MKGKVFFVGAGPGDPDLLTVKALKLLERADLVIYDSLVTKSIIDKIPAITRKVPIRQGPRSNGLRIEEFARIMVENALLGKIVVRLKSGDPLIFGRTWEEVEYLEEEGIEYEIVPGISSAMSSAAISRMPLTDRRFASSFAIVTGHESSHKEHEGIDWEKLAQAVDTLIVLMGTSTISDYSEKLLLAGIDRNVPVTVVYNASRQDQKILRLTLESASQGLPADLGDLSTVIINLRKPVKRMRIPNLEAIP